MKITFFTNLIHHHQAAVADEFYSQLGDEFVYVATERMPQFLIDGGYPDFSDKKYLLNSYESELNLKRAVQLGIDSDIVIIGGTDDSLITERLKTDKITFRYCERMFKKLDYRLLSPRGWWHQYINHTIYRNKNVYMLCAGGYVANDTSILLAYPQKKYKWGYFTKVEKIDIDDVIKQKPKGKLMLLWTARFLDWKRPQLAVQLAYQLKLKGYDFHLNMIGSGVEFDAVQKLIFDLKLNDCITLLGNMPNDDVRKYMLESNIFLFTSNRQEGWGAVLNEAMSCGCAVVASDTIGAVPYLVQNEKNGLIFNSSNLNSLVTQTETLINHSSFREQLGKNAYLRLRDEWSPEIAANNFLNLAKSIFESKEITIEKGPCSIAKNIKKNFWKKKEDKI
jgi:glycosyltransferase involved in cell wall biosynthesis